MRDQPKLSEDLNFALVSNALIATLVFRSNGGRIGRSRDLKLMARTRLKKMVHHFGFFSQERGQWQR